MTSARDSPQPTVCGSCPQLFTPSVFPAGLQGCDFFILFSMDCQLPLWSAILGSRDCPAQDMFSLPVFLRLSHPWCGQLGSWEGATAGCAPPVLLQVSGGQKAVR